MLVIGSITPRVRWGPAGSRDRIARAESRARPATRDRCPDQRATIVTRPSARMHFHQSDAEQLNALPA